MGLTDKIGIAILCAFVLFSVVRLFAAPLKLAAKVLLNTALGFLALFLLGLTEPVTGFSLGLNFFNALTVGILGVPGLVLLVLLPVQELPAVLDSSTSTSTRTRSANGFNISIPPLLISTQHL